MNLDRRFFLAYSARLCSRAATVSLASTLPFVKANAAASKDIETWMDAWMGGPRALVGPLHVGRFVDPMYFLLDPIGWKPNFDQSGYGPVTVPAGFVTDFASVPRLFWSLFRPDGRYAYAAVIHDYLYWTQTTSKTIADNIFRFGMEELGVGALTITALYEAVDLAGTAAWNENARLKATGEKRVLAKFPEDPRILWDQWKVDLTHFK